MDERKAVERVVERMYKDRLAKTGRLPDGNEVRIMEKKAAQAADECAMEARWK